MHSLGGAPHDPGETPRTAKEELVGILDALQKADPSFKAVVRRGLDRSPLETPENAEIAMSVRRAAEGVLGKAPLIAGVPFWTDAALLSAQGIPSLLFGPSARGRTQPRSGWTWRACGVRGGLPEDRDRFLRVNGVCIEGLELVPQPG